ncbi:DNA methyltransferase [Colwellia phage 9A]|uniref:site-specific DNA-methyltransferase (adenine-specific) n=1 Tax=Colwellia phage 9A TaxID=765765 RepID=I3UMG9_9CAUD|nr:DNA methyltransferase [Colwellia phage 9A]AFK66684.1 DNA adenine methylase [Colwellia phage 9A]
MSNQATNLLKYCGSKGKLLDVIEPYIHKATTMIVEPFCGSASVSLSQDKSYYLTDSSPELINFLQCVRDNPRGVIRYIRRLLNSEKEAIKVISKRDFFKLLRAEDREHDFLQASSIHRAARYYFILYHCFNGVYRVNQKGFCNIDFGGDNRKLPDDWQERIKDASQHINQHCKGIIDQQFDDMGMMRSILDSLATGEKLFVFIDPPYYDTFDMYTKEGTRFEFWDRLLQFLDDLDAAGIPFLMTNSHKPFILEKFGKYKIDKVPVKYTVSQDGKRPTVFEAFITNKV